MKMLRGLSNSLDSFQPDCNIEENLEEFEWGWKQDNICNKGKCLNELISVLEDSIGMLCKGEKEPHYLDSNFSDSWANGIRSYIMDYFFDYAKENKLVEGKNFRGESFWNFQKDILRYLKRFKNNEPLYLLSKKEKKLGQEFIRRLEYPPRRHNPLFSF